MNHIVFSPASEELVNILGTCFAFIQGVPVCIGHCMMFEVVTTSDDFEHFPCTQN